MCKAVFVLAKESDRKEVMAQLLSMDTFGDEIAVVTKEEYASSAWDEWIVLSDVVPNKTNALIIDHTGTTLRLGFVTDVDDRHTVLDMGKKQKNAPQEKVIPLPKECPQCKFVKPVKVWECPNCGYKPERQHAVVEAQGQLEELTRTQKKNNKNASPTEKAFFYGEAIAYGRERGRKDGWAANLYRSKYGVWPNKIKPFMRAPTPETLAYITAMNIRYAKGKGRSANV